MNLTSLLSAAGAMGTTSLTYSSLQEKYGDFAYPQAEILLGGKKFNDKQRQMVIGDLGIELSCGFEASIARFRIYNAYDMAGGSFRIDTIKKQVLLGNSLEIKLGYLGALETVFVGFVAGVSFGFDPEDLPYVEVTGMDVKGVMMANNYAMQLTAKSYGEAVKEILQRTAYERLKNDRAILDIQVSNTPDQSTTSSSRDNSYTVEMVSESDYEFVVKAARKFNFEFFVDRGTVYFRQAKSAAPPLIELGVGRGIVKFDVGYSITGLVETVEARAMDAGSGKPISAKTKYTGTLSTGSKAKSILSGSRKVYIDPTITSQEDADARARSLMEEISYRMGALYCECPGMPELVPGRFVTVTGMGKPVDNSFYITTVTHDFRPETGFRTTLNGKAAGLST